MLHSVLFFIYENTVYLAEATRDRLLHIILCLFKLQKNLVFKNIFSISIIKQQNSHHFNEKSNICYISLNLLLLYDMYPML